MNILSIKNKSSRQKATYFALEHSSKVTPNFNSLAAKHVLFSPNQNIFFVTWTRFDATDGKYVIKVSILVTILSFFVLRLLTVSVTVTKEDAYGELRQGRNVVSAMQTHMLKSSINWHGSMIIL